MRTGGADEEDVGMFFDECIREFGGRDSGVEEARAKGESFGGCEGQVGGVGGGGEAEDAGFSLDGVGGHVQHERGRPLFGFLAIPIFVLVGTWIPRLFQQGPRCRIMTAR